MAKTMRQDVQLMQRQHRHVRLLWQQFLRCFSWKVSTDIEWED